MDEALFSHFFGDYREPYAEVKEPAGKPLATQKFECSFRDLDVDQTLQRLRTACAEVSSELGLVMMLQSRSPLQGWPDGSDLVDMMTQSINALIANRPLDRHEELTVAFDNASAIQAANIAKFARNPVLLSSYRSLVDPLLELRIAGRVVERLEQATI
jgi:hypothetical protein